MRSLRGLFRVDGNEEESAAATIAVVPHTTSTSLSLVSEVSEREQVSGARLQLMPRWLLLLLDTLSSLMFAMLCSSIAEMPRSHNTASTVIVGAVLAGERAGGAVGVGVGVGVVVIAAAGDANTAGALSAVTSRGVNAAGAAGRVASPLTMAASGARRSTGSAAAAVAEAPAAASGAEDGATTAAGVLLGST